MFPFADSRRAAGSPAGAIGPGDTAVRSRWVSSSPLRLSRNGQRAWRSGTMIAPSGARMAATVSPLHRSRNTRAKLYVSDSGVAKP